MGIQKIEGMDAERLANDMEAGVAFTRAANAVNEKAGRIIVDPDLSAIERYFRPSDLIQEGARRMKVSARGL